MFPFFLGTAQMNKLKDMDQSLGKGTIQLTCLQCHEFVSSLQGWNYRERFYNCYVSGKFVETPVITCNLGNLSQFKFIITTITEIDTVRALHVIKCKSYKHYIISQKDFN